MRRMIALFGFRLGSVCFVPPFFMDGKPKYFAMGARASIHKPNTKWSASRPGAITMASKAGKAKFYAVANGQDGFCGVVSTWAECEALVTGMKSVRYKKFETQEEAEAFVAQHSNRSGSGSMQANWNRPTQRVAASVAPVQTLGSYGSSVQMQPRGIQSAAPPNTVVVYTDGACSSNGKHSAIAGVGVFFGDGDPRNVSEPLKGSMQTNNRAELTALIRALEILLEQSKHEYKKTGKIDKSSPAFWDVILKTDSAYCHNGITSWIQGWKKKGWKTSSGGAVLNQDLWVEFDDLLERLRGLRKVMLEKVTAHSVDSEYGNIRADELARGGVPNGTPR